VYDVTVVGPVGGRHIATGIDSVTVNSNTDLGDIVLSTGVIVSGSLQYQDDTDTGALPGAWIADFDSDGTQVGVTSSIAGGEFHLPTPTGSSITLFVSPDRFGLLELGVRYLEITGDMEIDTPFTVYSSAAQLPAVPTIVETGSQTVQEGQRLQFDVAQLRGTSIDIRFSDGVGGWVSGVNTYAEQVRGGLVTTVPASAATGDVVVRVDGVDGPGYPLTVAPGVYDPGPYTTSGTVDDGSLPVEDTFVVIFALTCHDEFLVDYDITGPSGAYSVRHGAGDYALFVLPPMATGLVRGAVPMLGVTGGQTRNVTLSDGHVVTALCVDSGSGPVGSTDTLADCEVGAVGTDVDHDEWMVSDDAGNLTLNLLTGSYEFELHAPFRSRYVSGLEGSLIPISGDVDLGDATLDSGYFIEGRIVDPGGDGLPGVEVSVWDVYEGVTAGETTTVGQDGSFRLAVPPGLYHVFMSVHAGHEYWVASELYVPVIEDLLLYPDRQATIAGHIQGTVVDTSMSPVEEIPVAAYHETLGFVRQIDTCPDGTYDLKVPDGNYNLQAMPSWEELCLADEFYNGHYLGCGADTVALSAPGTVTGIDFTLEPAGSISGTVVGDSGPLGDVAVCVTDGLTNPVCLDHCTTTGPDGSYMLSGVPVHTDWRVAASGSGFPWECWDDHIDCVTYDPVPVADCVETSGINFHVSYAPGPVPEGNHVPGTRMSARVTGVPGDVIIEWQPTCNADDHVIYFGSLGSFSSYTDAECSAGMSGTWTGTLPGGDLFFVVVGVNGNREGSYGMDSDPGERPAEGGLLCGYTQDLSATCIP
jgi:hypothetical protein